MADPQVSRILQINAQAVRNLQELAEAETAQVVESEEDFDQWCELSAFNPLLMARNFRTLEEQQREHAARRLQEQAATEGKKIKQVEQADEAAARFQKKNEELQAKTLLILKSRLLATDTPEEVLRKVLETYPDHSLADEALDFLIETTSGPMQTVIRMAKEQLNALFGREVRAGRNIAAEAKSFSTQGLGSPHSLRDLYREITGNPREPIKLFEELTDLFAYDKLKTAISFLLHALGADLKAKGPSISRLELKRLLDETRSLQGILGVFRFFQSRMRLIEREFVSYGLHPPSRLTFEQLAKQFIKLLAERFVNPEKILQTARDLGIEEEVAAQIIVYTQMRDAIKQVAPRYYRNPLHREELTKAILDTLEKLEEEEEEEP
jgi:type III secretion protein W